MSIFKNKKNDLYLSDKQPLTVGGKIALAISRALKKCLSE